MTVRLTDEELQELLDALYFATCSPGSHMLREEDVEGVFNVARQMFVLGPRILEELRELRAYKAQVERVKACPGDSLDECVNGARATLGTRGIEGNCVKCGGLPDWKVAE